MRPPLPALLSAAPPAASEAVLARLRSLLIVDESVRGADQRALWLRALASVHPWYRLAAVLVLAIVVSVLRLRDGMHGARCVPVRLGPIGARCRAALALGAVLFAAAATVLSLVSDAWRGALEERKDSELTEELRAAAAASAAYESTPEARQRELATRGVDSANWVVDDELSCETVGVFVNRHEQSVIVAFRGTASLGDWASNLRRIVPGDEAGSRAFQNGLATARRARDKYLLYRSFLLTGHSRGGAMADFVGRKLGLPAVTFNPATWGKVLHEQEPARLSVTSRTNDVISVLETLFPGDRQGARPPPPVGIELLPPPRRFQQRARSYRHRGASNSVHDPNTTAALPPLPCHPSLAAPPLTPLPDLIPPAETVRSSRVSTVRSRRAKKAERLLVLPMLGALCFVLGMLAAVRSLARARTQSYRQPVTCASVRSSMGLTSPPFEPRLCGQRFGWLDLFETVAEAEWLRRVGALACVLGLLGYYLANHPVTNFTVR